MVASAQQKTVIHALKAAIGRLGYRGDLLRRDYCFGDWFSTETPTLTAELAAFGQTPVSYSTACIGVVAGNSLTGIDLVRGFRSLGAPLVLEVQDGLVVPWRVGPRPTIADRLPSFRPDEIDNVFLANQEVWSPQVILRAKNIEPGQRQLDFLDLGLVPALEDQIRNKLDPILQEGLSQSIEAYKQETSRDPDERQLFQAAFWLLAGKVFHDREHEDFAGLSEASDPDEVLRRVGEHYSEPIHQRLLNKAARYTLQRSIWGSVDFRNLSVEVLAEIWSNTLVTPALRKRLGIHNTPRSLAKYMVDQIPFLSFPEEERRVLEPCCGSSRFLIAALQRLRLFLSPSVNCDVRHRYFTRMLAGYETDPFGIEISRLGLMLADYPNPDGWELHQDDVFQEAAFEVSLGQARVVLCNPPFEDFDEEARIRYSASTPRQPAELLLRVLRFLHPQGVLGFVLPRKFLDGQSYRPVREMLVERFRDIEILSVPEKAFTHAQADTAILLATNPRTGGLRSHVTHRKVDDDGWTRFQTEYEVSREDSASIDKCDASRSIAIPDLAELWARLNGLPTLGMVADIHRGIEWRIPISDSFEDGKENRGKLVREHPVAGFQEGVAPGTVFNMFVRPPLKYLSMKKEDRRGNSALHPWTAPKIIVNKSRRSRGRWRLAAFADEDGIVCYQTFVAVWPQESGLIEVLTAVLNGPVANAFVSSHEHGRDITVQTLRAIPVPQLSRESRQRVIGQMNSYLSAIGSERWDQAWTALLEVDSEVTAGYGLSADHERMLLQYFQDSKRAVPRSLASREYSPSSVRDGITFAELLAITRDWHKTNRRRCELIEERITSALDAVRARELACLQVLADKRLQLFAPLPVAELDSLLEAMHD